MPRRIFGHVRHNVVAYVALFFALTGTAVAASGVIKSSRQIKKGVVNAGDVHNNSLTSRDLRNGRAVGLSDFTSTALADLKASLGTGPRGPAGAQGEQGERGPSNGYIVGPAGRTLEGPGNYLLIGRGYVNNATGGTVTLSCQFNSTGYSGGASNLLGIATVPNGQQASVPVLGTLNITSGDAVTTLACSAGAATPTVGFLAIKTATLN